MSNNILVVVNPQNDYVEGTMSTPESKNVVPTIKRVIETSIDYEDDIFVVLDSHEGDYKNSPEGRHDKKPHCIIKTEGWKIYDEILQKLNECSVDKINMVQKKTFGSLDLVKKIKDCVKASKDTIRNITLVGYHTDVDILNNAILLKNNFKDIAITIKKNGCSGSSSQMSDAVYKLCETNHINVSI